MSEIQGSLQSTFVYIDVCWFVPFLTRAGRTCVYRSLSTNINGRSSILSMLSIQVLKIFPYYRREIYIQNVSILKCHGLKVTQQLKSYSSTELKIQISSVEIYT